MLGQQTQAFATWHIAAQRRRVIRLTIATVIVCLTLAAMILQLEILPVLLVAAIVVLGTIVAQPRIGVYLILATVTMFEDGGLDPFMQPFHHLYSGVGGSVLMPIEMLLLLSLVSWLAQGMITGRPHIRAGRLKKPVLLMVAALLAGLVRGAASGGNMYFGLWEARAFLYFVICYFLAASTIRTRRHVQTLLGILLVSTGLFAVEGLYRHFALVNSGLISGPMSYSHEDAVFLGTAILTVLAQHVFGAPRWQKWIGLLVVPLCLITLFASERRAGMIGTMVGFLAFLTVFIVAHRKAFVLIGLPLLIGSIVYLPLFWNNTSIVGQPARAIRSMYEPDARDASSNHARVLEKINVRYTLEENPLLGVGFGREYTWIVQLPVVADWPMQHYVSHHNLLWVWLKTGAAGYTMLWILMGSAIALATHYVKVLRDGHLRAFGLVALAAVIGAIVYSSVDTGLVSPRLMAATSILVGALGVLGQIARADPSRGASLSTEVSRA